MFFPDSGENGSKYFLQAIHSLSRTRGQREEMSTKEKSEKLKYYKVSCLKERTAPQVFPGRTDCRKERQGN